MREQGSKKRRAHDWISVGAVLLVVAVAGFVCYRGSCAYAAEGLDEWAKIAVAVNVSCDDDIKPSILSIVKKELRSFNDVVLVDKGADYELGIVALRTKDQAGRSMGIAVSSVFIEHYKVDEWSLKAIDSISGQIQWAPSDEAGSVQKSLIDTCNNAITVLGCLKPLVYLYQREITGRIIGHVLATFADDTFEQGLKKTVAEFDTESLERERKCRQTAEKQVVIMVKELDEKRKREGVPVMSPDGTESHQEYKPNAKAAELEARYWKDMRDSIRDIMKTRSAEDPNAAPQVPSPGPPSSPQSAPPPAKDSGRSKEIPVVP